MKIWALVVFVVCIALVLVQVWSANQNRRLTFRQMIEDGIEGVPLVFHVAFFGGVTYLPVLLVGCVVLYSGQWTLASWTSAAFVGLILCTVMQVQYANDTLKNPHFINGKATLAGWALFGQMWLALTILLQGYLATTHPDSTLVEVASVVLTLHMIVGTHTHLKVVKPRGFPRSMPVVDTMTLAVWAGSAVILAIGTLIALRP